MKKKWILLAEGLLLAVLFVLSFGGSDIVFEADHQQLYRVEETGGIVSKDFALNPGVYRIIVESDIANGGIGSGMEISLEAEETTFRAIRGNRATLSADTEHKRITYYVADTVDAAHLQIQPFSEGGNVSYELKVEKTTAGRRILFVIVLVLFACLDGIAIFRRKVLCKEVSGQKKWINCAMVGIWMIACIPLLVDYLVLGTDSVQCLRETEYMLQGEWGRIPAAHLLYLWIPAGMRWIGFPVATSYKIMIAFLSGAALALLYFLFSKWGKDARLVLAAAAFGIWNSLAVKTLYVMGNPGKFVVCVLGYAVLGSVVWILLQKRKSQNKISPWIVFAVLLILVLQVVYYENTIILQSDVQYWYNEEPFMTGE